jgi:mono/diheme cytochrome c family protein
VALAAAPAPASAADASAGRAVFAAQCAMCHGPDGGGDGPEASKFFWAPANFKTGSFKFRSTRSGQLPLDTDLARTIRRGLSGTAMVAQDHLTDQQVSDVIAHIKTLSPRWKEGPGTAVKIEPPANLEALAARGLDMYAKAGCAQCHGASGRGTGPSAAMLTANGRPTKPADLTRRPFKSGDTAEDVYRALATGMDGTPMPSFLDALDPEPIWTLAIHVVKMEKKSAKPVKHDDERLGRELAMKQPGRKAPPKEAGAK